MERCRIGVVGVRHHVIGRILVISGARVRFAGDFTTGGFGVGLVIEGGRVALAGVLLAAGLGLLLLGPRLGAERLRGGEVDDEAALAREVWPQRGLRLVHLLQDVERRVVGDGQAARGALGRGAMVGVVGQGEGGGRGHRGESRGRRGRGRGGAGHQIFGLAQRLVERGGLGRVGGGRDGGREGGGGGEGGV